jgi:hypothetical protein
MAKKKKKTTRTRVPIPDKLANYLWGCRSKIRYIDEATVRRTLKKLAAEGRQQYAYPCRFCNGWHTSSKPVPTTSKLKGA